MINSISNTFNLKNITQGIDAFNKIIQDFGNSMDSMTKELSSDIEKSNIESEAREKKNQENLDKIWGKKNWDVKSVKSHTKIQQDFTPGNSKFVGSVVLCVTMFLGMATICKSTGGMEIELS